MYRAMFETVGAALVTRVASSREIFHCLTIPPAFRPLGSSRSACLILFATLASSLAYRNFRLHRELGVQHRSPIRSPYLLVSTDT